jgi:hypothetical protein
MKIEKARDNFRNITDQELQDLLDKLNDVEIAAHVSYNRYLEKTKQLREVLKRIVGYAEENSRDIERVAEEYKSKLGELEEEKRIFAETVTTEEKEKILKEAKERFLKIAKIGVAAGAGIAVGLVGFRMIKRIIKHLSKRVGGDD